MFRSISALPVFGLLVIGRLAGAASGDLDPSFGSGGTVVTDIGGGDTDQINDLLLQPDGKLVAAGYSSLGGPSNEYLALARYNTNGTLDSSFGTGGIVTTQIVARDGAGSVALQTDGKIVAAASVNYPSQYVGLARYNTDGSLDSSFGVGGTVTTLIGAGTAQAWAIAIQLDGKIVIAGQALSGSNGDFALARYNTDGSLDTSFDTDGKVTTPMGFGSDNRVWALVLQPDGKIVAAGQAHNGSDYDFTLARYNTDGSLDISFGTGGVVSTAVGSADDYGYAVSLQADGKLVAAGYTYNGSSYDLALVRYDTNGSLDSTFDVDGIVTTAMGAGLGGRADLVRQPDGKLVAASAFNVDFAVARYNTDGSLDGTFGSGGIVTTPVTAGANYCNAIVLQPDCNIVAAGAAYNPLLDFALARYLGDCAAPTPVACPPTPQTCRTAEKTQLLVKDSESDAKDKLLWRWTKGESTTQTELADPTSTADYALCLYAGSTAALISEVVVPASASRWKALGKKGYKYDDSELTEDGVRKIQVMGSNNDKSKAQVKGRGDNLPELTLPLEAPVTVQLINAETGVCMEGVYDTLEIRKNTDKQFKAKSKQ